MGALNTAEPLSGGYTVQVQSVNDQFKISVDKWLA